MGLTVAEAFILLSFILLLLFTWWQIDTEKRSLRLADSLGEMSDADKASIIAGLSDGTFAMARALRAAGLGAQDQAAIEDTERYSRFMREEDLKRLMSGAVELEPGTRLKLSEVVEVTPEMRLRATLEDLLRPSDAVSQASERLAQAAAAEEGLIGMLERELGDKIRAAGGDHQRRDDYSASEHPLRCRRGPHPRSQDVAPVLRPLGSDASIIGSRHF
ncbi:hypothetical protein ACFSYD_12835 [Paracoccus aerius]